MMFVMFAYSGWNASAYIAGEMKDPRRTLPLSLLAGTGIVIVLYLAVNLFILQSVPFQQLQGMEEVVKEASVRAFGSGIGNLLGLLTGLALLSSLSAYIILGPRVYYAMAQDRLFLPIAARVHPRYGVPGISILIQGVIAIFMVITGTLEQITYYVGFALGVFPWLAIAGIFLARKKWHRGRIRGEGMGISGSSRILPGQQPGAHERGLCRQAPRVDGSADHDCSGCPLLLPLGERDEARQPVMARRDAWSRPTRWFF